jgi:hypothetical protein
MVFVAGNYCYFPAGGCLFFPCPEAQIAVRAALSDLARRARGRATSTRPEPVESYVGDGIELEEKQTRV